MTAVQGKRATFQDLPDTILGVIGGFVEKPVPYLCTSKRISKQAPQAYRNRDELASKVLLKCNADVDQMQPDFLKGKLWRQTITSLNLSQYDVPITDDKLRKIIDAFPNLQKLFVYGTHSITDEGVQHIAKLPLQELQVSSFLITDVSLAALGQMKTLKKLILELAPYTRFSLAHLCENLKLEDLYLYYPSITNEDLESLSKMDSLIKLTFPALQVTDVGIQHLTHLTKLQELDISFSNITGTSLEILSNIKTIKKLRLGDCWHINNAALSHLKKFTNLQEVVLPPHKIKNLSWKNIVTVSALRKLYIKTMLEEFVAKLKTLWESMHDPKKLLEAVKVICQDFLYTLGQIARLHNSCPLILFLTACIIYINTIRYWDIHENIVNFIGFVSSMALAALGIFIIDKNLI